MSVVVLNHVSAALANNPLRDPSARKLHVIVTDDVQDEPVPCLWFLAGYGSVGRAMLSDDPWQEGLEERILRLRQDGQIGPMIVVLPDAFTRLGGGQYLSSPAVGDYETYLFVELKNLIEARWPILAHGVVGKSSGGYGAIVHAMRRPELFRAVACHSGDMGFEISIFPEIPRLMDALRRHGSVPELMKAFERDPQKKSGRWFSSLSTLALASVFSPITVPRQAGVEASVEAGREAGPDDPPHFDFALPFDLARGLLDHAVLARWLAHDPVHMIDDDRCQAALRSMNLVFLDCGRRDEHFLHYGALAFHQKLERYGIRHEYEEFDDGHRGTSYRLDVSIPKLYRALACCVSK